MQLSRLGRYVDQQSEASLFKSCQPVVQLSVIRQKLHTDTVKLSLAISTKFRFLKYCINSVNTKAQIETLKHKPIQTVF